MSFPGVSRMMASAKATMVRGVKFSTAKQQFGGVKSTRTLGGSRVSMTTRDLTIGTKKATPSPEGETEEEKVSPRAKARRAAQAEPPCPRFGRGLIRSVALARRKLRAAKKKCNKVGDAVAHKAYEKRRHQQTAYFGGLLDAVAKARAEYTALKEALVRWEEMRRWYPPDPVDTGDDGEGSRWDQPDEPEVELDCEAWEAWHATLDLTESREKCAEFPSVQRSKAIAARAQQFDTDDAPPSRCRSRWC